MKVLTEVNIYESELLSDMAHLPILLLAWEEDYKTYNPNLLRLRNLIPRKTRQNLTVYNFSVLHSVAHASSSNVCL